MALDEISYKEEIEAKALHDIFKVQPVYIIPPIREYQNQKQKAASTTVSSGREFERILEEACRR